MSRPYTIVEILIEVIQGSLVKAGRTQPRAKEEAERAVREILGIAGGQKWHIPKRIRMEGLELRDAAIRDAARRGVHRREICRTFHISVPRFYQIINAHEPEPLQQAG